VKTWFRFLASMLLLGSAVVASRASAFDANQTFAQGTFVISAEGSYGEQFNLEGFSDQSDIRFWNAGLRASMLPFGPEGPGFIRGAFELGLQPLYQRYLNTNTPNRGWESHVGVFGVSYYFR
jgi:hypothetical protein